MSVETTVGLAVKLPVLFAAGALHHIAFTSPNPPAKSVREIDNIVDKTLFASITFVTVGQKAIVWAIGAAEAAVTIANHFPQWKYSKTIREHLIGRGGDASRIQMNLPFAIGTGLLILGGALRWKCSRVMGPMYTYEVTVQNEHKLVTSGPYGYLRHPAYSGVLMCVGGIFIWQGFPGSWLRESGFLRLWSGKLVAGVCSAWISFLATGGILRAKGEDKLMKVKFGESWDAWAARVPYLLVPFVF